MNILANRFVVPRAAGVQEFGGPESSGLSSQQLDGLLARVVKYVPTEVIAIYTGVIGLLGSADTPRIAVIILVAVALLAISVVVWRNVKVKSVRTAHLVVSNIAFLAWAYPISAPLLDDWFVGWVSAVAQGVVLFLALIFAPEKTT